MISTPNWAICEPSGPMLNGTTYIVRPAMQPSNSSCRITFISAGSIQLFVGPASSLVLAQMNVRSSTRATSLASERARKLFGRRSSSSLMNVPRLDELGAEAFELLVGAVAPMDVGGSAELDHLGDPAPQAVVLHVLRCFHGPHRDAVPDARPRTLDPAGVTGWSPRIARRALRRAWSPR